MTNLYEAFCFSIIISTGLWGLVLMAIHYIKKVIK